eukprot:jgi/Ulvmu1/11897/UM081_0056.1
MQHLLAWVAVVCSSTEPLSPVTMSQLSGFTDELESEIDHLELDSEVVAAPACAVTDPPSLLPARGDASHRRDAPEASNARRAEDECSHRVIYNSICADCFKDMSEETRDPDPAGGTNGAGDNNIELRYLGLKVSQRHLREQSQGQMRSLLSQKKLVVVLDLDHTMLHTELKSRLKPEAIEEIQRRRHTQQLEQLDNPVLHRTVSAHEFLASDDAGKRPLEGTTHTASKRTRNGASLHADVATSQQPGCSPPHDPYAVVHDNGDSFTKLRPGAFEMLAALRDVCELRIFTMGDARYAAAMASLLDASGGLFRNRIVARDDANQARKGLEKAGAMPPLTMIIDDTVEVWRGELPNLIRIPRYHFFRPDGNGVVEQAEDEDLRSGPLAVITRLILDVHGRFYGAAAAGAPAPPNAPENGQSATANRRATDAAAPDVAGAAAAHVAGGAVPESGTGEGEAGEKESEPDARGEPGVPADAPANRAEPASYGCAPTGAPAAASTTHSAAPPAAIRSDPPRTDAGPDAAAASASEPRDVRHILDSMRRSILAGCVVSFSRIFDASMRAAPEKHALWQLALALGATCAADVTPATTHLVTLSCSTDKARAALRQPTRLVSPDWLVACECGWRRLLEEDFPAPAREMPYTQWRVNLGGEHAQAMLLRGRL